MYGERASNAEVSRSTVMRTYTTSGETCPNVRVCGVRSAPDTLAHRVCNVARVGTVTKTRSPIRYHSVLVSAIVDLASNPDTPTRKDPIMATNKPHAPADAPAAPDANAAPVGLSFEDFEGDVSRGDVKGPNPFAAKVAELNEDWNTDKGRSNKSSKVRVPTKDVGKFSKLIRAAAGEFDRSALIATETVPGADGISSVSFQLRNKITHKPKPGDVAAADSSGDAPVTADVSSVPTETEVTD